MPPEGLSPRSVFPIQNLMPAPGQGFQAAALGHFTGVPVVQQGFGAAGVQAPALRLFQSAPHALVTRPAPVYREDDLTGSRVRNVCSASPHLLLVQAHHQSQAMAPRVPSGQMRSNPASSPIRAKCSSSRACCRH